MKLIEIYESVGCCSGNIDKELIQAISTVNNLKNDLKNEQIRILRHNLPNDPQPFVDNKAVNAYMLKNGVDALPITLVDGKIVKSGAYPSGYELCEWVGVDDFKLAIADDGESCSCGCTGC